MVADRDDKGRFTAGNSGGGRPKGTKGLAEQIKCQTKDGQDILAFLLAVMNGREKGVKIDHRIQAAQMLMDRGWGKAIQQTDITTGGKELRIIVGGDSNLPAGV